MKRLFIILLLFMTTPLLLGSSYNYSFYGDVIHSAPGMTFATYFNAQTLETPLGSPEYFVVYNNDIYMIDSERGLFVIDETFKLKSHHDSFELSEAYKEKTGQTEALTLKTPFGLDVKPQGIYLADSGNARIIRLNFDFKVEAVYSNPQDPTFESVAFFPIKITVEKTGRMYVISRQVYEGIVELSESGEFNRFTGVNPLRLTPLEIFRRSMMTEVQLAKLRRFLPTEYTSVSINENSFIYATSKPTDNNVSNTIQLINPKGVDVIKRNGYHGVQGEIHYIENMNNYVINGPSMLVDIDYTKGGIFSVLDQKRSRIFTYDSEGNLLYINGDEGQQSDKFKQAVAIGYHGDDLIVLDRGSKTFIVYRLTEFGTLVNQAVAFHDDGRFEEAHDIWIELLKKNANYEIAYNGIGKHLLREGKYKEAMANFKLGHDKYYYSKAFKEYRNNILRANFGYIFAGVIVVVAGSIGLVIYKKRKKGESLLYED